jgi:polar amino acid transport system permease protein
MKTDKWDWQNLDYALNPEKYAEDNGLDAAPFESLYHGLWITIQATFWGALLAISLGLVFAIMRRSEILPIRAPAAAVVEFVRSTPLLVQLFFLFFVLPEVGISLGPLLAGVIGLGLHYATYMSEVYRAGIEGVPVGQWEASTALSLPRLRVWTSVILPQAIPRVLPALGNYVIAMFKDVPLLSTITVIDMMAVARAYSSQTFASTEVYTAVGVFFLVVSIITAVPIRMLERRYGHV